jgi:hypothetical protein
MEPEIQPAEEEITVDEIKRILAPAMDNDKRFTVEYPEDVYDYDEIPQVDSKPLTYHACKLLHCIFYAEQALQYPKFKGQNKWADDYDFKRHELDINHEDLKFFFTEVEFYNECPNPYQIVAWLQSKYKSYGRVWRKRGFWEKAQTLIDNAEFRDILAYVQKCNDCVERYTYASVVANNNYFARIGGTTKRLESLFCMEKRRKWTADKSVPTPK